MTDTNTNNNVSKYSSNNSNSNANQNFYMRKMNYQGSLMVNICDEELLGKNIESDTVNITISNEFFNEIVNEDDITRLLKRCSIANLIGRRVVDKTLGLGLAKKDSIKVVSDIPFLMIFKFQQNY
ncbi:MAG: uncharacterized protein K0S93_2040 [Nitrososphaeraceae archaeon]|jgi:hypothetical protein|nr:uncharacterized protein [Nitrososphaeraceae archaeon]